MKIIFQIILCCCCFVTSAQQFIAGKIIDSLSVGNNQKETFTLYLPSTFVSKKEYPIVFIFSPSGNGKKGIETFIESAEVFEYILVCSNNSQNGSLEQNLNIAQRLFNHASSNFNILQNRIYLAGFSGGARLATAIASVTHQIEGVIACGAGFISNSYYMPSDPSFSYAAICGERDMNYREMFDVKNYLDQLNFHNALFIFDGKHQWPPNEQLLLAFNWLEMEAIRKGHATKSKDEIGESYSMELNKATRLENNNQLLIASQQYDRILNTYSSYFNLDTVRQRFLNLVNSKDFSKKLKNRDNVFIKEESLNLYFSNRFDKDYSKPHVKSLKWWAREFEKMDKKKLKSNSLINKMYDRVRFNIFVKAYTIYNQSNSTMSEEQLQFCKSLISLLQSKQ